MKYSKWNKLCPECGSDDVSVIDTDGYADEYTWACNRCNHSFTTFTTHILG